MLSARLPSLRVALLATLVLLLWAVVGATWFLRTYLGPVTPDQVLFHLQNGGLDYADPRMISRGLRCAAAVLLLTLLSVFLLRRLRRWHRVPLLAMLGAGAVVSVNATVSDPCQPAADGGDYLALQYVDPGQVEVQLPVARPDVLLVFVESLDQDYTHPRDPAAALVPQLTQLQNRAQTLGTLRNLHGASWTMGGIFSALCGLPLQPVGLMSRNTLEFSTRFFAGGRCLTDLLAARGWEVSFYGGAALQFAGKGRFLQQHGVTRRFGADQWRQLGAPLRAAGWGVPDSELAERAWADMQRPRAADEPRMNLLLTVDTHGPTGATDPHCDATPPPDGPDTMRAALRCVDRAVVHLVERFVEQRDGRPKVVLVMGDHINPEPLLNDELQIAPGGRTLFHALARYDADGRALPAADQQREFTHVDVLPTLAHAMGLRWSPQSERLGLGVSLLADGQPATLAERDGMEVVDGRLSCRSPLFERLWTKAI